MVVAIGNKLNVLSTYVDAPHGLPNGNAHTGIPASKQNAVILVYQQYIV